MTLVTAGILPLALLARPASTWARDQRVIAEAVTVAGEAVELAGMRFAIGQVPAPLSLLRSLGLPKEGLSACAGLPDSATDAACLPGGRQLAVTPFPGAAGRGTLLPWRIALWARP